MTPKSNPKIVWMPTAHQAIQFKLALKFIRPLIWRRILVPNSFTLGQLHSIIQITMGWYDCHLHMFRIGDERFSSLNGEDPDELDMDNENDVVLKQIITRERQKFHYEYDFGDSWEHEVIVEKLLLYDPQTPYPVCLAGARACPPEDCGGFPGYLGILETLAAPQKSESQKKCWNGSVRISIRSALTWKP